MPSTTLRNNLIGKQTCMGITIFAVLLVLAITLYPYDFHFEKTDSRLWHNSLILGWGKSDTLDILINVLFFIPLGFGLTGYLIRAIRLSGLTLLSITVLTCFILTYTVEMLQIFLPFRAASFCDVLSNVAGGLLGLLCFLLLECKDKATNLDSAFMKRRLQIIFLGYATFAIFISIPLQWESSFSNWDKTFHLLLGNERTGDRPWQGCVYELYIADRAISETEAAQIFSKKKTFDLIGDSILAAYQPVRSTQTGQLTGIESYHDQMGHLPDLVWRGEPQDVQKGKGVFLSPNHWLETVTPARYLSQRIINTSQFTLCITLATSDIMQTGPARIVTLSEDTVRRNFTLGQKGSDLIFRLRTPLTGENGTNPYLTVPDVFSNKNLHNLVITYNGSDLFLYVDGVRNSHFLKFNPGTILFGHLFHLNEYNIVGFTVLYYALVFIPLGILMTLIVKKTRGRFVIKILTICGGIVLSSLILEGVLMIVSGRVMILENLLISMICISGPMVFLNYYHGKALTMNRKLNQLTTNRPYER
jgi:VanZ family protein